MPGTFFFEDGTSKEGYSYNNNVVNGSIEFSNNEDSIFNPRIEIIYSK